MSELGHITQAEPDFRKVAREFHERRTDVLERFPRGTSWPVRREAHSGDLCKLRRADLTLMGA